MDDCRKNMNDVRIKTEVQWIEVKEGKWKNWEKTRIINKDDTKKINQ